MGLIDTHTHLDSFARNGTLPEILRRAKEARVDTMVTIGTAPDDWSLYRELATAHGDRVRYTAGLHPCSVDESWEKAIGGLEGYWSRDDRPVALGEIGLDRFHLPKEPEKAAPLFERQKAAFAAQLEIASRLGCPVVIHSRGAFAECVGMIDHSGLNWRRVVFHCFSEGAAEIAELNKRGGRGSFTGVLTYKSADNVREAAKAQGLALFMVETDAPYLTPVPHRGKANEPSYLRLTAEYAAELFGVHIEQLEAESSAAAREFYGLR